MNSPEREAMERIKGIIGEYAFGTFTFDACERAIAQVYADHAASGAEHRSQLPAEPEWLKEASKELIDSLPDWARDHIYKCHDKLAQQGRELERKLATLSEACGQVLELINDLPHYPVCDAPLKPCKCRIEGIQSCASRLRDVLEKP
jgi:hypothetical protein